MTNREAAEATALMLAQEHLDEPKLVARLAHPTAPPGCFYYLYTGKHEDLGGARHWFEVIE